VKTKEFFCKEKLVEKLLNVFQKLKFPEEVNMLQSMLEKDNVYTSKREIIEAIKQLNEKGYDVKKIEAKDSIKYGLVRFGHNTSEAYYRILGNLKLPLLLTSDWHTSSKGFSKIAIDEMKKDVVKHKIKDICCMGDLMQGLGVYSIEAMDVTEQSIDGQEDFLIEELKEFPSSVTFHAIMGNHEEKIKGKWMVGHDSYSVIAKSVNNFKYYGQVAKLMIENKFSTLMVHGKGGAPYAWTYMIQRIMRNLVEKPNVLLTGHLHQLGDWLTPPFTQAIACGTLQRESAWLMQAGITAQVGWIIIDDMTETEIKMRYRIPKIF